MPEGCTPAFAIFTLLSHDLHKNFYTELATNLNGDLFYDNVPREILILLGFLLKRINVVLSTRQMVACSIVAPNNLIEFVSLLLCFLNRIFYNDNNRVSITLHATYKRIEISGINLHMNFLGISVMSRSKRHILKRKLYSFIHSLQRFI